MGVAPEKLFEQTDLLRGISLLAQPSIIRQFTTGRVEPVLGGAFKVYQHFLPVKLGANQIDAAAKNLLMIKKQFESDPKGKPPAVLCVLCGMANAAYRRPDGVFVVPITALKN